MHRNTALSTVFAITVLALFTTGCSLEGEEGQLGLHNKDNREFLSTERDNDLAVGTQSTLSFHDRSLFANGDIDIRAAKSTHPDIIRVVSIEQDTVTVEALQAGQAELIVESDHRRDRFELTAHRVARVSLGDTTKNSVILVNSEMIYTVTLYDSADRVLSGALPLDIKTTIPDAVQMRVVDERHQRIAIRYTIAGDIDLHIGEHIINKRVVDVDAVDRLESPETNIKMNEDGTWSDTIAFAAYTEDSVAVLGISQQLTIEVSDEDACTVTPAVSFFGFRFVEVSGDPQSPCEVIIRLGSAELSKKYSAL